MVILVPRTSFSALMPFRRSEMIASMVLLHSFPRDSMLSQLKYVDESNFVSPLYIIRRTEASDESFTLIVTFSQPWNKALVTGDIVVSSDVVQVSFIIWRISEI